MSKPNPMGGSFAERKAAAEGESSFDAPKVENPDAFENTTFAERSKKKPGSKAVGSDGAENKAVKSSSRKN